MGYASGSSSQDGRDDDDEDEYEEGGMGNRFLGFMFGNVDNSGDLDVDYLDEDAKEHLSALADKLGASLTDIDLSAKSQKSAVDVGEQDYDEKAEDAVDYEDIDEQYDGPEVQDATEEDYLLPKKDYFSTEASFGVLESRSSIFDDEDYDEELNNDVDGDVVKSSEDKVEASAADFKEEIALDNDLHAGTPLSENLDADSPEQEAQEVVKDPTPLPVLCIEDGVVILRFSEIFAVHEPLRRAEKREHRYSVPKDRGESLDLSDMVEEDEEVFLKEFSQRLSVSKSVNQDGKDVAECNDDMSNAFSKFGELQGAYPLDLKDGRQEKESCLCAEPMKVGSLEDLYLQRLSLSDAEFYMLDQANWEDEIIWGNSSSLVENNLDRCEISGSEFGALVIGGIGSESKLQHLESDAHRNLTEKGHDIFSFRSLASLKSFATGDSSELVTSSCSDSLFHPQLLRLESRHDIDSSDCADGEKERMGGETMQSNAVRRFTQLATQNRDMVDGSWLEKIIWEEDKSTVRPKLILDLQDDKMVFEVLDDKNSIILHPGAMVITRPLKLSNGESCEVLGHGGSGWRHVANDKHYSNRKSSQQLKSNSKKRSVHGIKIFHSQPALKLQTMKLKLSNKDIANFHRPKALWYPHDNDVAVKEQGKLPTQGPMKIIMKSLGGKGTKLHVDTEETISSVKTKASKKLDFKLLEPVKLYYLGKELKDDLSLSSQSVQPNSVLHLVRSKIHLLPRAQKIPGDNKSLRPPGAFKKKSDLSAKDGHVFLMEYCEERPLLLSNVGMGARLCMYYQKSSPDDQNGLVLRSSINSLGHMVSLDPSDKSPFLGDLKPSCSLSSLETNMYRAPIFPHKVASTDYLLIRSPKGKLSLRRIDKIHVVGQQEPLMEVLSPGSKNLQTYMLNRLLVHMCREFQAAEKRQLLPLIRADELHVQFPYLPEASFRKRIKEYTNLQKASNGQWNLVKKRNFRMWSEDELRKMVTPELVCAYESMQTGLYRLKHLGITETHPTNISSAMSRLPDEAIALAAASHIERELQITPWNLSNNFVACTSQGKENIERLEISGVGDPSGRGLGFSYARAPPKAPVSNAVAKKKPVPGRVTSTVTGTDADLRRLSMEAAREVLLKFNVPEEVITKQTRWHRIAMIRKLSSEQAASGVKVDPTTIGKYARGQRMSFLQLQQQTREKCQEIWDRQLQNLSAVNNEEHESDSDEHSDLDSFAGDLENLLDAEEYEEGAEGNNESKREKADGVKGLKMRGRPTLAQAEEEMEDEAAEAAELRRLLMDDDEDCKKKKKKIKEMGLAPKLKSNFVLDSTDHVQQVVSPVQREVVSRLKESTLTESKEGGNLALKGMKLVKVKSFKKNVSAPMDFQNKKLKIAGDGVKIFKEKKSARESFVCGACGQLGHMRTNKNCPKYGEEQEPLIESTDLEKASGKSSALDPSNQHLQKNQAKKLLSKSLITKVAPIEPPEAEKSSLKAKVVPVKFKCSSSEKTDKLPTASAQSSERQITSDPETEKLLKVNKIIISNKPRADESMIDSHKPSVVIRPPVDGGRGQIEYHRPSVVIRAVSSGVKEQLEHHRPSIVIRPPSEVDRDQSQKKIIIKRPKEVMNVDQHSPAGNTDVEPRKLKSIAALSNVEKFKRQDSFYSSESSIKPKVKMDRRFREMQEKEKRRNAARLKEDRERRLQEEERRMLEEQEKLAEIRRYEANIRREREEEEREKAKKKKKMPEFGDDYLEDPRRRRYDKRMIERDRSAKRKSVVELGRFGTDNTPQTKRRRGGEVGLANILERVVETLKDRQEISYLFLRPVTKKEAPDYLDIIKHPMDLSTIKEKVRRMTYKNREDFRHDVWQITFNAHRYNDGRNPGIPPLADQLLELCDYLLNENDESLTEAEAGIENRDF